MTGDKKINLNSDMNHNDDEIKINENIISKIKINKISDENKEINLEPKLENKIEEKDSIVVPKKEYKNPIGIKSPIANKISLNILKEINNTDSVKKDNLVDNSEKENTQKEENKINENKINDKISNNKNIKPVIKIETELEKQDKQDKKEKDNKINKIKVNESILNEIKTNNEVKIKNEVEEIKKVDEEETKIDEDDSKYDELTSKVILDDEKPKTEDDDLELFGNYKSDFNQEEEKEEKKKEQKNTNEEINGEINRETNGETNEEKNEEIKGKNKKNIVTTIIISLLIPTLSLGLYYSKSHGILDGVISLIFNNNEKIIENPEVKIDKNENDWKITEYEMAGYNVFYETKKIDEDNTQYKFNEIIYYNIDDLNRNMEDYINAIVEENKELRDKEIEKIIIDKIIETYLKRAIEK